ncbi:pilin [Grimontia hollisae]|uniref:pilin n=1 Tax=Grimontia hollisae TaxID=673 RepID=UPI00165DF7D4|nr:pilin [Grimontia hollisae]
MKKQQGFSLIELMIVVAVIGVLSAVAIPQYQNYVAKSQAASALATMTGLKTNIESSIAENSAFPTLAATDAGDATLGVPPLRLGTIALAETNAATDEGTMTFAFGAKSQLAGNLILTRGNLGGWVCSTTVADTQRVPVECR